MRLIVQRVQSSLVSVNGQTTGEIAQGLLVLIGVTSNDTTKDAEYLAREVISLRIFTDESGKMNRNVREVGGSLLVVSNFTLYADVSSGNRPSFTQAAPPALAEALYSKFLSLLAATGVAVASGVFGAHMKIQAVADGPVTILLDSPVHSHLT